MYEYTEVVSQNDDRFWVFAWTSDAKLTQYTLQ